MLQLHNGIRDIALLLETVQTSPSDFLRVPTELVAGYIYNESEPSRAKIVELDELEQIRERKMHELMNQTATPSIDRPIAVSDRNFDQTIRSYPLVVVDCWAAWCAPCRAIAPIVEQLARDYSGKIVFGKLNVDENPETQQRFGIMAIPTLLIIKNGEEVDRVVGALPKTQLEERINNYA